MDRESPEVFAPIRDYAPRPWGSAWTAEGVIELLEPLVGEPRKERIRRVLDERIGSVIAVLDSPYDPHNGAAVMRSCDAFGVQELHVVERHDTFLASNVVSKGAERWVDVLAHRAPLAAAQQLQERGYELITTHPEGELVPEQLAQIPRLALVLGNEHDGICEELTQSAGRSVRIPMVGFVESLNVSVSAAILLRAATHGRPGDLDPSTQRSLYAQGLMRSLKRADDILGASTPR